MGKCIRVTMALMGLWLMALAPAHAGGFSLGVAGGTLGVGLQAGYGFTPYLALRGILAGLDVSEDFESQDLEYDGDAELRNAALLLDWHPLAGVFRISAGVVFNDNRIEGGAGCDQLVCDFGAGLDVLVAGDRVEGEAEFDSAAPYIGIGWSRAPAAGAGWGLGVDIGLMRLGDAQVDVQVSGPSSANPLVASQAAAEEEEIEDDLDSLAWYPVLMVGVNYRF